MNQMGTQPAWSGAEQFDAMVAPESHDFGLLDFDNIDLDFDFGAANPADANQQLGQLADELDVQHLHNPFSPALSHGPRNAEQNPPPPQPPQQQQQQQQQQQAQQQQQQQQQQPPQQPQHHQPGMDNLPMARPGHTYFEFSMPPYTQSIPALHQQGAVYRPHGAVPATPNSMELHGDPGRYMQHMEAQQAMFDQRFQMRKDDMTFTPLVSPAVTPHEARFQVQDMTTVPGAYFSPLTSPALNAQNHAQAQTIAGQYATTSGSSTGASPNNMDVEMLEDAALGQTEQGRKLRSGSKRSTPRSSGSGRVRQSPIVKPARRKPAASSLPTPKEVANLVEQARGQRAGLEANGAHERSTTDSISPEPLSDMGPPPKPVSVTPSPAILAQGQNGVVDGVTPATPASLMRIQPSPTFGAPDVPLPLDNFSLPEASLARPPLPRVDTAIQDRDVDTPRLCARKTPKLAALSTPSGIAARSGKPSPLLSAISSPTSPAFSPAIARRGEPKAARGVKKRNSIGSNLVSPALRPKISPSIKPLLPDGGVSDDTHALLLASKSNYQNILDGTTVPGVIYPTSLSTNLTSKRTSHKIAEQGRRNRINTALQEMQELLPSSIPGIKDSQSPDNSAGQSNNSKAAKVESAIEYIKQLQQQVLDKDRMLSKREQEMESLRRELAAFKQGSGDSTPGVSSSESTQADEGVSTPLSNSNEKQFTNGTTNGTTIVNET